MKFNEQTHEYTRNGKTYISVTQLLEKYGLSTNYSGIPKQVLQNAANRGKAVHKALELFINGDQSMLGLYEEVDLFNNYIKLRNIDLTKTRSEEIVYNDKYLIAGTIDFQYTDIDDKGIPENIMADFKNTSTLHYDVVSWQLSLYNFIKCQGDLIQYYFNRLKCFHFKAGKLYVRDIALVEYDAVLALLEANLRGDPTFNYVKPNRIIGKAEETLVSQILQERIQYETMIKKLDKELKPILAKVQENMLNYNDYTYSNGDIIIKYVHPQNRKTLNTTKVKKFLINQNQNIDDFMNITTTKGTVKAELSNAAKNKLQLDD